MKKCGFTLAEILLAMALVGVIAAMTVPTFVTNTRNKANASRLATMVSIHSRTSVSFSPATSRCCAFARSNTTGLPEVSLGESGPV